MSVNTGNTTAGHDKLIRDDIWSVRIQEELQEALMAQSLMEWITDFPDGDILHIPKLASLTTRDYVENSPITVDDPTVDEFTLSISEYVQSGISITDKMRQDTFYMNVLDSKFPDQMIRAILERLENDIFLLHKKQTNNDANTINGRAHRFVASGTSSAITIADVALSKLAHDKANVSKAGRRAYVDPQVANQLINIDNVIRQDVYGANSALKDGFGTTQAIGRYLGYDFYESNMLDEATALDYNTGGALIANLFVGEEAFVGAMRLSPEMERSRDWERKRDVIHATSRYGLGLFRAEALVTVLTGAV